MNSKTRVAAIVTLAVIMTSFVTLGEAAKQPPRPSAGRLEVRGSQKGRIAIVNRQTRVATKDLEEAVAIIAKQTLCKAQIDDGKDAQVVIEIVDRKGETALVVYPEDHKAIVNVDGVAKGLSGEALTKFLASRCRKEILRAFCYACGHAGSQFPNNIMAVSKLSDLDLVGEFIPGDTANICQRRLKGIGVTPKQMVSYMAACRQGWAPAPTNDVQKAIWDKVHELPNAPIKILPETKPVKD